MKTPRTDVRGFFVLPLAASRIGALESKTPHPKYEAKCVLTRSAAF